MRQGTVDHPWRSVIHREAEPNEVSDLFLRVSSRLLLIGMVPLALGICTDLFLVADVVCHSLLRAGAVAAFAALLFAGLWFLYPVLYHRMRR